MVGHHGRGTRWGARRGWRCQEDKGGEGAAMARLHPRPQPLPCVTSYPQVCQHVQCSLFPSFLLFRVCAVYVSVCLYVRQFLVIHCLCLSRGPGEARNPLSLILHQAGRGAPGSRAKIIYPKIDVKIKASHIKLFFSCPLQ